MEESLQDVKRRVRDKFLGRSGIHGLATRQDQDAIVVYLPESGPSQAETLAELRDDVAPHQLIVQIEERPYRA